MKITFIRKKKRRKWLRALPKLIIPILIVTILVSTTVLANVNNKWDWHKVDGGQHKRKIHWCWCPDAYDYIIKNPSWIQWIVDAAANWNNANTGWELEFTDDQDLCQVCIGFDDIDSPGQVGAREITDDGWIGKAKITFDKNLKNNKHKPADGWGRTGNNVYDPVVVGKHEFGHLLRLDHGSGDDKMDVDDPGYHDTTLSDHDIQEAKDSATSTGKKIRNVFRPFGYFESDNGDVVFIPEGALLGEDSLTFDDVIDWIIPNRMNVPQGYISTAIEISTESQVLGMPIAIWMAYTDREIGGGHICYLPMYYPPLIETGLQLYRYNPDTEHWDLVPSAVDPTANQIFFETLELGMYGISGPPEYEIILPGVPGKPSGPPRGSAGKEYTYSTTSVNPEGDQVYYWFDWGDESGTGWIGPYESVQECEASHIWLEQGNYEIKVKAENEWGWESDWSDPLSVTMPRNRAINGFFLRFLEHFPLLQKILCYIL